MNISLSAHAAPAVPGAPGTRGKSGDPLADFMALLGQLGIAVEREEGTATTVTTAPGTTQDLAAKLLAKFARKSEPDEALPGEDPSGGLTTDGDGAKQEDPVAALVELLSKLDPTAKGADPAKLDVASLLAAVRAAAQSGKPATVQPESGKTTAVAATSASSIAALLARTTPSSGNSEPVPGNIQSLFARLQTLADGKGAEAKPVETADSVPVTDQHESQQTVDGSPKLKGDAATTKLAELLAKLMASTKPGASQPQTPAHLAANPAASHAARVQADPQLSALAQAIQQTGKEGQPVQDASTPAATSGIFGIAPTVAPAHAGKADAVPADMMPKPADEVITHHLDLARDTQWLDTLARDISRAAQSDSQLRFQLNPEHLGSLKVELLNGAHGTAVKLTTETEAARAILADAQPRLVAEARAQGLRISEAHVDLGGHGGGQRHMAETPVVIRTASGSALAEVEQDRPAASGERYA